jgi:large subunit ribosomal protein L15
MKLHDLRPAKGSRKRRRRVARGNAGTGGTYGGRGVKGQNSRSGGGKKAYFEGGQLPLVRRLPFVRGFTNIFRVEYVPVNLDRLAQHFEDGAEVTPTALAAAGVLRHEGEPYKVLAGGALDRSLTVHAPRFSASARAAIEEAGGRCESLPDEYQLPGMRREHKRFR